MCYDHEGAGAEIRSLEQNPMETELQMLRRETEQREACSKLRMQVGRLEVEAASRVEQLNNARQIQPKLEDARDSVQQRGAELAHRGSYDQRQWQTWKIVVSLQGYSIPVRASVETSHLIRPFERRGACERRSSSERLRRSQNWNYCRLRTSSARRMQVMELSYPVEEALPPSRGWSTDAPSMYPELQ